MLIHPRGQRGTQDRGAALVDLTKEYLLHRMIVHEDSHGDESRLSHSAAGV